MIRHVTTTLTEALNVGYERYFMLIAAGLVALLAAFQIGSALNESPTADEVNHLAAGYFYLTTGEYSLDLNHPPLGRILAAMPLLSLPIRPVSAKRGWADVDGFFWRSSVSPDVILMSGRLAVVTL